MPTALIPNPAAADGASAGGSATSSSRTEYTGTYADPNAAGLIPDDPTKAASFYQDVSITKYNEWKWSVTSQTWIQTSAP